MSKTFSYSFKTSLPVMAGYIVLGFGFGIMMADRGFGWQWAALMSLTVYAGSMQYVAVDLIGSGATLIATALMTLMVNLRHFFYGISMLGKYRDTGKAKPYLIFSLTDETFSLLCDADVPEGVDRRGFYLFVSLLNQLYWVVGCTLGGVLGSALNFDTTGVDFSMTALFVVIFVEQWEKKGGRVPAVIGVGVSLACLLIFGSSAFLIPSLIIITALLMLLRGRIGEARA